MLDSIMRVNTESTCVCSSLLSNPYMMILTMSPSRSLLNYIIMARRRCQNPSVCRDYRTPVYHVTSIPVLSAVVSGPSHTLDTGTVLGTGGGAPERANEGIHRRFLEEETSRGPQAREDIWRSKCEEWSSMLSDSRGTCEQHLRHPPQ